MYHRLRFFCPAEVLEHHVYVNPALRISHPAVAAAKIDNVTLNKPGTNNWQSELDNCGVAINNEFGRLPNTM